jgi:hypothetical protein
MGRTPITRRDWPYLVVQPTDDGQFIPAKEEWMDCASWRIRSSFDDPRIVDLESWCMLLGLDRNRLYGAWLVEPNDDG